MHVFRDIGLFGVGSLSSAGKQALLYLFCKGVALGPWQETEWTSEGLNEGSLMRGLLLTCGRGSVSTHGWCNVRTSSKGKPLRSPGCRDKRSQWWNPLRVVIAEEGPRDRRQSCQGTYLLLELQWDREAEGDTALAPLLLPFHLCPVPPHSSNLTGCLRARECWHWAGEAGYGWGCCAEGMENNQQNRPLFLSPQTDDLWY